MVESLSKELFSKTETKIQDQFVALNEHLKLLAPYLYDDGVTEISINKPGEVWLEKHNESLSIQMPELGYGLLRRIVLLTASANGQRVSDEKPLLSATLPSGQRIQCVLPPACPPGRVIISIRRQNVKDLSLEDYENQGFFNQIASGERKQSLDDRLLALKNDRQYRQLFEKAVIGKKTILISGGCATGKSTFLNTLLSLIPGNERLVTIEDAREVQIKQSNHVPLLYSRNNQSIADVTPQMLVEVSLRLRPDRIIMGELRGEEAFYFLRAANTGHEGSASTLHADSPEMALKQLCLMCMQAGFPMKQEQMLEYITSIVDIVAQIKIEQGKRYCSEVWLAKEGQWIK